MSSETSLADAVVIDASATVEIVLRTNLGLAVTQRVRSLQLHAPAHIDAEVLSAVGRLNRAGAISDEDAGIGVRALAAAPMERHPLPPILLGAWSRRSNLRLVDALYVELAASLQVVVVTTDGRLANATERAELVT